MKKRTSKTLFISLLLSLLLAMSMMLASCGGPSNLEEYIDSNEELAQQIESYSSSGMDIDITENTLTYTYKYNQTYDASMAELMSTELEKAMASQSGTFESVKQTLVDETGFEDIVVKIVYTDGEDKVLYETEY